MPRSVGWVLAAYAIVVAVALLALLIRRQPTVWRARGILAFHAAAATALALAGWTSGWDPPRAALGLPLTFLAALWLARRWWLVLGGGRAMVLATVERCARRLCARATPADRGATVEHPRGQVHLRLRPLTRSATLVALVPAAAPRSVLLRRLLAKQFHPALPRPRIRMR